MIDSCGGVHPPDPDHSEATHQACSAREPGLRPRCQGCVGAEGRITALPLTDEQPLISAIVGGKSVPYTDLVKGQQLGLAIPVTGRLARIDPKDPIGITDLMGIVVTGNPPMKPIEQYKVIGDSHPRPSITDIVTGKAVYSGDVKVPGMLHARMVRPASLGSTLVSAGKLDKAKFPTAEVVVQKNLVAVVSPNERRSSTRPACNRAACR